MMILISSYLIHSVTVSHHHRRHPHRGSDHDQRLGMVSHWDTGSGSDSDSCCILMT